MIPQRDITSNSVSELDFVTSVEVERPPSVFDKCNRFFEPGGDYHQSKALDLYPYFRQIERNDGTRAIINGQDVIMAGSNNYLGLTSDPRVIEATQAAVAKYGSGCTGSRFLNGTLDLHIELEERLAAFMRKEQCILFSTGYMTNQGVIEGLASKNDILFSDKENHASIVAGTRVSLATTSRYRHGDLAHLRWVLEKADRDRPGAGKIIVSDGVFSMSGAIAQVPELVELAKAFNAALLLDDAHAIGVIGPGGRGSAAYFGLSDDVHLTTGTFSKTFSSLGGFCVGDRDVIEYIRHSSSAHIFSASMPPSNVATVLKCLDILQEEPERLDRLQEISDYMREGFRSLGFHVLSSQAPILSLVVGDMMTCFRFWRDLLAEGVFVNAVVPPAVPQDQALLRTSYMATHTNEDLDFILDAFGHIGLRYGITNTNGHTSVRPAFHANGHTY